MSLFTGATKIDAVYVGGTGAGGSGSLVYSTVKFKSAQANQSTKASWGQTNPGDLIVLVCCYPNSPGITTPPGFTLLNRITGDQGLGKSTSQIFYKLATTSASSGEYNNLPIGTDWTSQVFSGVNPTKPFGAYAHNDSGTSNTSTYTAPAITMTEPNGYSQVISVFSGKSTVVRWNAPPGGYGYTIPDNFWNQWVITRNDRTTAAVAGAVQTTTSKQNAFAHTFEILANSIMVEPGIANAVYLGTEKVWPVVTGADTTFSIPGTFTYTIPAAAKKLDFVALGAGGGGGKGEWLGEGRGALPGQWAAVTLTVGLEVQAGQTITIQVGKGGVGNANVLDLGPGKDGGKSTVLGFLTAKGGIGGGSSTSQNIGMPSIPGGNPDPTNYVYNGKTYVGGVGGTSVGVPNFEGYGLNGNDPGVGGFGGENITVGIAGGGHGGDGCVWVHAY